MYMYDVHGFYSPPASKILAIERFAREISNILKLVEHIVRYQESLV